MSRPYFAYFHGGLTPNRSPWWDDSAMVEKEIWQGMGDPNLRACIQPTWLPVALNKADCVQFRADERIVNATFICALLNQPSTEKMAQELMHGQTRVRISMGRLRGLEVPVPSIDLQHEFARRVTAVEKLKTSHRASLAELDALFAALQHRAFRGEL